MLKQILSLVLSLGFLGMFTSGNPVHAATGDTSVARWKDNRTACFLLMFDDGYMSMTEVAIPELVKRGLIATFYIPPNKSEYALNHTPWETTVPPTGMVYANHSWDHAALSGSTAAQYLASATAEVVNCNNYILSLQNILPLPDKNPRLLSFGQPGTTPGWQITGAELTQILAANNLINRPAFLFSNAAYIGPNTVPTILSVIDGAITSGTWTYFIAHGVERRASEGDAAHGYQDFWAWNKDLLRGTLDAMKARSDNGSLWVTDHVTEHKYLTERTTSTVQIATATNSLITVNLTSTTDPYFYDFPLTLRTAVPATWIGAVVTQGTQQSNVPVVSGTVMYEALPNGGAINLTESVLPVVTVGASTPEAYETGTTPGAFTVKRTGTAALTVNYTIAGSATNGTRYSIAASPVLLSSASTTVNVVPRPNAVWEGEQNVVMTIAPGAGYVVGTGSSAFVVVHDRTDVPPVDWYLHTNQATGNPGEDWNTKTTWWSQPTGGTQLTALSPGTVNNRFHTNGYILRTPSNGSNYPTDNYSNINQIVLDGTTGNFALRAQGNGLTNTVLNVTSMGGSIVSSYNNFTQNIGITGTFTVSGSTTLSCGAVTTNPASGIIVSVAKLTGTAGLYLTNASGVSGTTGSISFGVSDGGGYSGTLKLVAGTLSIPRYLGLSGPFVSATNSAIVLNAHVTVPSFTIGNTPVAIGNYTADQLNGQGVVFSGSSTLTVSGLSAGWADNDIGSPGVAGYVTYDGTTHTLFGCGAVASSGTMDKFNYASKSLAGDGQIVARVASVQNTGTTAKAGVMFRESLSATTMYAMVAANADKQVAMYWRSATSGASDWNGIIPAAWNGALTGGTNSLKWVKLVRSGNSFSGYYATTTAKPASSDWVQIGTTQTIAMSPTVRAGLAVTSGSTPLLNTSTFTDASLDASPVITMQPQSQAATVGDSVALSVSATAASTLSYQWKKNLTLLMGATNSVLTITNAQLADAGSYTVVVSAADLSVTSAAATLTVDLPSHAILAGSLPAASGTTLGSGTYVSGTTVTVTAIPSAGYGFAAWSESGTSVSTAAAYPFTVTGPRTLVANFRPASAAAWKASCFVGSELADTAISGVLANPDHDQYNNLLEYALGMNPKIDDNPPLLKAALVGNYLTLTYQRSRTAADLSFIVEVSSDLQTWSSGLSNTSAPIIQSDDGYTQTVQVNDLTSSSSENHRFIRLRVTNP